MKQTATIPFKEILINEEKNCRDVMATRNFLDLVNSISTNGLQMPVIVRPIKPDDFGHKYELVAGFRRCRATQHLGIDSIWAIIDDKIISDEDFVTTNLIENLNRVDLSISEQAKAVSYYVKQGYSLPVIASIIAQPLSWVEVRSKFLQLPADVREVIQEFKLSNNQVNNLYRLRSKTDEMYELVRQYKSTKQKAGLFEKDLHLLRKLQKKERTVKGLTEKKHIVNKEEVLGLAIDLDEQLGLNIGSFCLFYVAGEMSLYDLHNRIKDLVPEYRIPDDIDLTINLDK
jgi:ParB/RepB/Spo0J family partition protein